MRPISKHCDLSGRVFGSLTILVTKLEVVHEVSLGKARMWNGVCVKLLLTADGQRSCVQGCLQC